MNSLSNAFVVQIAAAAPGVSPNGTQMPPASELIDGDLAKWTVLPAIDGAPGQIGLARNGVRVRSAVDYATIKDGVIYESDFGSGVGWERWNGSAFVLSTAPF